MQHLKFSAVRGTWRANSSMMMRPTCDQCNRSVVQGARRTMRTRLTRGDRARTACGEGSRRWARAGGGAVGGIAHLHVVDRHVEPRGREGALPLRDLGSTLVEALLRHARVEHAAELVHLLAVGGARGHLTHGVHVLDLDVGRRQLRRHRQVAEGLLVVLLAE